MTARPVPSASIRTNDTNLDTGRAIMDCHDGMLHAVAWKIAIKPSPAAS